MLWKTNFLFSKIRIIVIFIIIIIIIIIIKT